MVQFYAPKRKPQKNKVHKTSVQIEAITTSGEGAVFGHKPPIFVEGGLPQEKVDVEVVAKHNNHWRAKAKSVSSFHDARQTPQCQWINACGGCTTQHCDSAVMLDWKQSALNEQFKRAFNADDLPWHEPIRSHNEAYRRKARLAYDGRDASNIKLGFRASKSSRIVSIPNCLVLAEPLQLIMTLLHEKLTRTKAQPIGHITLLAYDNGIGVTVNFVKPPSTKNILFWETLIESLVDTGHRVDVFLHNKQEVVQAFIQDSQTPLVISTPLSGSEQASLQADANDFIQVNCEVNQAMVKRAADWLAPKRTDHVLELFSGLGNFTYSLAALSEQVLAIEGSDIMVQKAKLNAQQQGIDNIDWQCADLSVAGLASTFDQFQPNAVLLDPSREGAEMACEAISRSSADRVVYVSCNPQTWVRDAKKLLAGQFTLAKLSVMDMFPYTPHTELISLFERH